MRSILLAVAVCCSGLNAQTTSAVPEVQVDPGLVAKAKSGDANSQAILGAAYASGSRSPLKDSQALFWLATAAGQGNSAAETILGEFFYEGRGVEADRSKAAIWYRKAADQGNAEAQYNLGLLLHDGLGVPQDLPLSAHWIREAAEQGMAEAELSLAKVYATGAGVTTDDSLAVVWYRKAAEQGNAEAQLALGLLYDLGKGVPPDQSQSASWYRKAAEQGVALAQLYLGEAYSSGSGVPQDYSQSLLWFRRAADQGLPQAEDHLGFSYANALGVPKDYGEAAIWFRKAAEQGDPKAQHNLAVMYLKGLGVPRDRAQAISWERRANEQPASSPAPTAIQPPGHDTYGEAPVYEQIRALVAKSQEERPAKELEALKVQNELDRQKAVQQYRALLSGLQGEPTPEQQAQLERLKAIINVGDQDVLTGTGNVRTDGNAVGNDTSVEPVITPGPTAETETKATRDPAYASSRGFAPRIPQVATTPPKTPVPAFHQTLVNCPQEGSPMIPTGTSKLDTYGHKICEYTHQVTPPYSAPQPYDPLNPQPYKAPPVTKHIVWTSCS